MSFRFVFLFNLLILYMKKNGLTIANYLDGMDLCINTLNKQRKLKKIL